MWLIKCLQTAPEERYASALALYNALEHAIRGENAPEESTLIEPLQTTTRPAAPASATKVGAGNQSARPAWLWQAIGAGVLLLLVAVVWGVLRGIPAASPTQTAPTQTEPLPVVQVSATLPLESSATPAPTSTAEPSTTPEPAATLTPEPTNLPTPMGGGWGQIAFASTRGGNPQIWVINSDGTNQLPLTNVGVGACQPTWSADGLKLAYISPCTGSGIRETYPNARIYILDLQTKETLQIPSSSLSDYQPTWSPDGKTIAFSTVGERQTVIALYDVESGTRTDLTMRGGKNIFPAWSPDSTQIAYIATTSGSEVLWLMQADGIGQRLYISLETKVRYENPAWSTDGSTLVFTKIGGGIAVSRLHASPISSEGAVEVALSEDLLPRTDASYSPDGLWLVFDAWLDGSNHDIYIAPPDNLAAARQLTTNAANDFHPAWRPTGTPAP